MDEELNTFKYVWLNLNNGEFSNSWSEDEQKHIDDEIIQEAKNNNWKLIKYQCLTDEDFEFYSRMKVATSNKE